MPGEAYGPRLRGAGGIISPSGVRGDAPAAGGMYNARELEESKEYVAYGHDP